MKHPRTTILGILTIVGAVATGAADLIKTGTCDFAAIAATVAAGVGLIKAADAKAADEK